MGLRRIGALPAGQVGLVYWNGSSPASQSPSTGAGTAIQFDTVEEDPYKLWASANRSRLTVPAGYGGLWQPEANFRADITGTPNRLLVLVKMNGTTSLSINGQIVDRTVAVWLNVTSGPVRMVPGDYVEFFFSCDSVTPSAPAMSSGRRDCWASMTRIAA